MAPYKSPTIAAAEGNKWIGMLSKGSESTSLASIVATLIPTTITAAIFIAVFLRIRDRYRELYAPRTFMGTIPEKDRTPSSRQKGSHWFHDFRTLDDKFVLQHQSLDGYLFLRFFKLIVFICTAGCCFVLPILLPVNATGGGDSSQLDRLTFSNVNDNKRLYAHAIVSWLFLGLVIIAVTREQLFLVGARQAYISSKSNASRLSSRVVLFLFAPKEALREDRLQDTFGSEAQKTWIVADHRKLENLVSKRNARAMTLEAAEVQLIREANRRKMDRTRGDSNGVSSESGNRPAAKVPDQSRPKHKPTPVVGTKVDTVEWGRKTLPELQRQVQEQRERNKATAQPESSAVFVAYSSPAAAQRAYHEVGFHPVVSKVTKDRILGVQPKEVIWANLSVSPPGRISRVSLATALEFATILFWAIPIGLLGAISNINHLTDKVKFLRFLDNLPSSVIGLISGLVPPLAISTLISYVPKIFRTIRKTSGDPTTPQAELKTQNRYFIFQVIQVFLVTTFSSGAAAVATKIAQDPSQTPTLLAKHLPQASNFYLAFILVQGTASAAKNLLNYSDLFQYLIYDRFFDKTPRDKYNRFTSLKNISWGSVYPKFTNLAVIAIAYSCIAPLILVFASAGLYLFYLSFRYNMLYVLQPKVDSKGECYGRALQHLFTGVYLSELCLVGLFGAREAPGPSTLMIILLIATIIYHSALNRVLNSVKANFAISEEGETLPLLAAEEGNGGNLGHHASQPKPADVGLSRLPSSMSEPIANAVESYIALTRNTVKSVMNDPSARIDEDEIHYTEEEMQTAYLNPAMTSKPPKLWLVRDEMGVSKHEIEENEAAGIVATDEGAFLDSHNRIRWAQDDFSKVPIFKEPVKY